MIAIETTEKDGIMTVRPCDKKLRFPAFTEIEIKDNGNAIGWLLTDKPRDTQMYQLGTPGKGAVAIEQTTQKIVFKLNR